MRKPRTDAPLLNLPETVQAELAARLRSERAVKVVAWLRAEHKVETSAAALYRFHRWWLAARPIVQAREIADEIGRALAGHPAIDAEALSKLSQTAFEVAAVKAQDPELYFNMRKLRQRDLALEIARDRKSLREARERIAELEAQLAAARNGSAAAAVDPAAVAARLDEALGRKRK